MCCLNDYIVRKITFFIITIILASVACNPLCAQTEKEKGLIKQLDSIAFAFEKLPNYDSAIFYYKRELSIYISSKNNKEIGRSYLKIGRLLSEKGEIAEASKVFFKMLKYAELANDTSRIAIAFTRIGRCYEFLNKNENAFEYYEKGLEISEKYSIHKQSIALYGTMGNLYLQQNKFEDCRKMAVKADSLAKKLNDPYFKYGADNLYGLYYSAIKDYTNAEKYMLQALAYNLQKNPNASHTGGTYFNLGEIAAKQNKNNQALIYYSEAFRIFKNQNEKKNLKDISYNLANLYANQKNYTQAYEYQKLFSAYNDSVINEETTATIAELQTKYEVEKKDIQILLLDKEKMLKEQKLAETRRSMIFYIGITILLLAVLIFSVLFFTQRQKTIAAINKKNVALVKLQTQMNPHFLFNALVSVQDLILKEDKLKAINSVTKLSRLMRTTLNNSDSDLISLEEEINFLTTYVEFENERNKYKTDFQVTIDEAITSDWCLIPPMLIQPLVENCFKHAFLDDKEDPKISLSFVKKETATNPMLEVKLSDNGIGINSNSMKTNSDSKAMKITLERLNNLYAFQNTSNDGKIMQIQNNIDDQGEVSGTSIILTLPFLEK
jgi:tetratricopeptide (TPR) repeat protein/two-component sensor histidine kinase